MLLYWARHILQDGLIIGLAAADVNEPSAAHTHLCSAAMWKVRSASESSILKHNSGIVPFVATPFKGRFFVFSQ